MTNDIIWKSLIQAFTHGIIKVHLVTKRHTFVSMHTPVQRSDTVQSEG